jgi:hypothetical protein
MSKLQAHNISINMHELMPMPLEFVVCDKPLYTCLHECIVALLNIIESDIVLVHGAMITLNTCNLLCT